MSDRSAAEMLKFVKSRGLEGVVAKRSDSIYQPGQRTGLWSKYRINLGQEFVIGGYVPSHLGVDSQSRLSSSRGRLALGRPYSNPRVKAIPATGPSIAASRSRGFLVSEAHWVKPKPKTRGTKQQSEMNSAAFILPFQAFPASAGAAST